MFGRGDDKKDNQATDAPVDQTADETTVVHPEAETQPATSDNSDWQHPGTPIDDQQDQAAPEPVAEAPEPEPVITTAPETPEVPEPALEPETKPEEPAPAATPIVDVSGPAGDFSPPTAPSDVNHDLIDIKQQALTQLSPLVGHLEQSPEEKFRTYMMMIQASDNQSLLKDAYAAAQQIEDEKVRAQALLDVVNEINYFTQPNQQ